MSLYLTEKDNNRTKLTVYNIESEREEVKILDTSKPFNWGTCITHLPNGDLFCFGTYPPSGETLIIDNAYRVKALTSGITCWGSSCIYFNNNTYCFGGYNNQNILAVSCKFELIENRWINLTPMPQPDWCSHSVIFNRNILISGLYNRNLLLYSIDIDSFSAIPYDFAYNKRKILIKAERFYLIECGGGLIYESEDEYNWKQISNSIISHYCPAQVYCSYDKGVIYISTNLTLRYYKFDLSQKLMTVL